MNPSPSENKRLIVQSGCRFFLPVGEESTQMWPPYLGRFLFKLLDGSLVDASTLVDEVACGGGLAGVHMANHNDVDVKFLLTHGVLGCLCLLKSITLVNRTLLCLFLGENVV